MRLGARSESIALAGMILGILAGAAFMLTSEAVGVHQAWLFGAILCLLRIVAIKTTETLQPSQSRQSREEQFYNELPERVSDAITLMGFGFAAHSNAWLGLAAALTAIASAYARSLVSTRTNWRRYTGFVPMRRAQRLLILSAASFVLMENPDAAWEGYSLPSLALILIVSGCLLATLLQWLRLRGIWTGSSER